ncbi:hypothetical protein CDD83_10313 [Cordyceps sp. RAO-2017]|nr:hypothetical protein CDD83_10313 [Cordyceps sp. RAO-2017]
MPGGASLEHIDAVDAFARTLFLRAQKQPPSPSLADIAQAVRQLHQALRHLRIEAADPDSLFNKGSDSAVYAPQVRPLLHDCDFALKQLETLLDRSAASAGHDVDAVADRVAAVRARLDDERTRVEMLLDTVQLHNPAGKPPALALHGGEASLESIKDKVDSVAAKLFRCRKRVATADDEDWLWQEFKSELEKEGFSPQVLRQHKEVLRAYIRELDSTSSLNGGAPPSVRGLLKKQAARPAVPPPVPPKEPLSPSAKDSRHLSNVKAGRHHPRDEPATESHSFSSSDGATAMSESTAMISTKDLVAMDSLQSGMAGLHLHPHPENSGSAARSTQKYLTSGTAETPASGTWADTSALASSPSFGTSPGAVHSRSVASGAGPHLQSRSSMQSRLAPDRYGKEIPMDAQWTKIRRSLVSPEVLERAGVRYEARPEYVAVLGRLTREQVAGYARQSAECRAARSAPPRTHGRRPPPRRRADSRSSRDDDDVDSELWDESDTTDCDDDRTSERGKKSYPRS